MWKIAELPVKCTKVTEEAIGLQNFVVQEVHGVCAFLMECI